MKRNQINGMIKKECQNGSLDCGTEVKNKILSILVLLLKLTCIFKKKRFLFIYLKEERETERKRA